MFFAIFLVALYMFLVFRKSYGTGSGSDRIPHSIWEDKQKEKTSSGMSAGIPSLSLGFCTDLTPAVQEAAAPL